MTPHRVIPDRGKATCTVCGRPIAKGLRRPSGLLWRHVIPALAADTAALAKVESTLGAIAALLNQDQLLHAVTMPDGRIALVTTTNPGIYAKVLGTPEQAVAAADMAFLRAGLAAHGTGG